MTQIAATLLLALVVFGSVYAGTLSYTGSSTIGKFIESSRPVYGKVLLNISTITESDGGEQCVLDKRCDLGGVAREVDPKLTKAGIVKTLIGRDTIAVIVDPKNPIQSLTSAQIKGIFTGRIVNWSELGGADIPIKPYIARQNSATHRVFRQAILGDADYQGVTTLMFDGKMIPQVFNEVGSIGQITSAFLTRVSWINTVDIDGVSADDYSGAYPITRPLYLLTAAEPAGEVKAYLDWVVSDAGQSIVKRYFGGLR